MASRTPTDPAADQRLLADIRRELVALLDAVPGSRRVLAHLAVLEKSLAEVGLECIDAFPDAALDKAATQLAGLPMPRGAQGLPKLLMLMRLALEDRQQRHRDAHTPAFLSSFLTDEKLQVREASATDFMRALDELPPKDRG